MSMALIRLPRFLLCSLKCYILKGAYIMPNNNFDSEGREHINPYRIFINCFVPIWLLRRTEISKGAKLTYARLCRYAGKNGQCFPKQSTLAKELGCSTRTMSRYLRELRDCGLIESVRVGKRCSNRYFFLVHDWMEFNEF